MSRYSKHALTVRPRIQHSVSDDSEIRAEWRRLDMGLYRCLPYLVETGMGAGKTPEELDEERNMVIGARVWLALYKLRYE